MAQPVVSERKTCLKESHIFHVLINKPYIYVQIQGTADFHTSSKQHILISRACHENPASPDLTFLREIRYAFIFAKETML